MKLLHWVILSAYKLETREGSSAFPVEEDVWSLELTKHPNISPALEALKPRGCEGNDERVFLQSSKNRMELLDCVFYRADLSISREGDAPFCAEDDVWTPEFTKLPNVSPPLQALKPCGFEGNDECVFLRSSKNCLELLDCAFYRADLYIAREGCAHVCAEDDVWTPEFTKLPNVSPPLQALKPRGFEGNDECVFFQSSKNCLELLDCVFHRAYLSIAREGCAPFCAENDVWTPEFTKRPNISPPLGALKPRGCEGNDECVFLQSSKNRMELLDWVFYRADLSIAREGCAPFCAEDDVWTPEFTKRPNVSPPLGALKPRGCEGNDECVFLQSSKNCLELLDCVFYRADLSIAREGCAPFCAEDDVWTPEFTKRPNVSPALEALKPRGCEGNSVCVFLQSSRNRIKLLDCVFYRADLSIAREGCAPFCAEDDVWTLQFTNCRNVSPPLQVPKPRGYDAIDKCVFVKSPNHCQELLRLVILRVNLSDVPKGFSPFHAEDDTWAPELAKCRSVSPQMDALKRSRVRRKRRVRLPPVA
ncbi:hypothetical protein MRX96_033150 [Rhipicephalus microplus]